MKAEIAQIATSSSQKLDLFRSQAAQEYEQLLCQKNAYELKASAFEIENIRLTNEV